MEMMTKAHGAEPSAGWGDLLAGANGARSIALAGGVALHAINVYIATTILPSVVADIGGLEYYAWNTTLFVVSSVIGAALSSKVLERQGPRGAYRMASLLFAFGVIICALAPTMSVLLAGRTAQGFGGGLLVSFSYAMIRRVFTEPLWPRAMALVSGMWGVATLLGPLIGGIFAQMNAWRWAFWSLLPLIAGFMLLSQRVIPARRDGESNLPTKIPISQLALLASAVLAVSAGSILKTVAWNIGGVVTALVLMSFFVATENRGKHCLLPRRACNPTTALGAIYATIALLTIGTTTEIFVPLILQVVHHLSPLMAGYLTAFAAMGWTAAALLGSGFQGKKARMVIIVGPFVMLVGLIALAFLLPGIQGTLGMALIALNLVLVGFGVGMGWPHLLASVLTVVAEDERDLASASITTIQLLATAFGAALAGMVANLAGLTNPGGVTGIAHAAMWLFAVFSLSALLAGLTAYKAVGHSFGPQPAQLHTAPDPAN
jgi:MFS family permease